MRVLLVSHNFVTEWRAGVEVYTHDLAHALRRCGVDVSVLYTTQTQSETRVVEREEHGLPVFRLETPHVDEYGVDEPNQEIVGLFRRVAAGFDIVHFQHTYARLPFAVVEAAKHTGARVALTLHDAWFLCARTHLRDPSGLAVCSGPETDAKCARCLGAPALSHLLANRRAQSTRALAACDRITAPSRFLIQRFEQAGIPFPIEHEPLGITPVEATPEASPDYRVFAFLGSLSQLKNVDGLVRAFRETPGAAGLWIFGTGPERASIEALAAEDPRIELFGKYDAADLPEILSRVDAVVLPSFVENYPLVLREALSAGVPALASDVGGIPEIVQHEQNGLLFDPTDEASICGALSRALHEPGLLDQLRAGVRPPKTLDDDARRWAAWYGQAERSLQVRESTPKCSIVIPVYNRCDLTRACISALRSARTQTDYELIVSDDGSSDETRRMLDELDGQVRVVRSDVNRGFATACNTGEEQARSEIVVFLNNDTLPCDGWLDPLVEELIEDRAVGVVGSRLLYPDGRLQHAGVLFSKLGGRPYHMLRGTAGDAPAVTRRRELRAVTGACMAVRRTTFRALGGFDLGYRNGFEDIDLCLRTSERGEKIVYRPDSVLVHRESQTPGRRAHEVENQRLYIGRWGEARRADEDWVLDTERLGVRATARGSEIVPATFVRGEPETPVHWERIVDLQAAAARGDREHVRAGLRRPELWPPEVLALFWGVWMAEWVGDDAATTALTQRLEGAGVKRPDPEPPTLPRSPASFLPVL